MKPYLLCGKTVTYANKALNPPRRVKLYKFIRKIVSASGASRAQYDISTICATVQLPTQDQLEQMVKISTAGLKKLFWIDSTIVQGLNRNIPNADGTYGKGQDWIEFEGTMHNVVLTFYEALDDFNAVVGAEDASFDESNPTPAQLSDYMGVGILK